MTSVSRTEHDSGDHERPVRARRGAILSYGQGRTCAAPACRTLLSRYNKDHLCWAHANEFEAGKHRGR